MSDDAILRLAGKVEGYSRRNKSGKSVHVSSYWRVKMAKDLEAGEVIKDAFGDERTVKLVTGNQVHFMDGGVGTGSFQVKPINTGLQAPGISAARKVVDLLQGQRKAKGTASPIAPNYNADWVRTTKGLPEAQQPLKKQGRALGEAHRAAGRTPDHEKMGERFARKTGAKHLGGGTYDTSTPEGYAAQAMHQGYRSAFGSEKDRRTTDKTRELKKAADAWRAAGSPSAEGRVAAPPPGKDVGLRLRTNREADVSKNEPDSTGPFKDSPLARSQASAKPPSKTPEEAAKASPPWAHRGEKQNPPASGFLRQPKSDAQKAADDAHRARVLKNRAGARAKAAPSGSKASEHLNRLEDALKGKSGNEIDTLSAAALVALKDKGATTSHYQRLADITKKARYAG